MKAFLREQIKLQLKSFSTLELQKKSLAIEAQLKDQLQHETGTWLGFQSLVTEPVIRWHEVAPHIRWAFPKTENTNLQAVAAATDFKVTAIGVREPVSGQSIAIENISGVVAPALAFDQKGYRLGRGGGYYDRYLQEFKNKKIGLCFDLVLQEQLPTEKHDVQFDMVITENKIYLKQTTEGAQQWN